MRGRLAPLAVSVATAAILTAAFSTAAAAGTVKTFAVRNGVTSVTLTVPHTTGLRPPAILLSTRPANLRCSVLSYRYHAIGTKARFNLRTRCRKVGSGAHGRLVFRRPFVRVLKLHDGTGAIRLRLDKFPGTAVPLGQLTTRPRATKCTATPTGRHVGTHVFTASARVSCHGLPHNAKAVLAVGACWRRVPRRRPVQQTCWPGRPPQRPTSEVQPRTLRIILVNDFAAAVYVEPTTA